MFLRRDIDIVHSGDDLLNIGLVTNDISIEAGSTSRYCQRSIEDVELAQMAVHLVDIADTAIQFATKPDAAGVHIGHKVFKGCLHGRLRGNMCWIEI
jgi:hypothetical protein